MIVIWELLFQYLWSCSREFQSKRNYFFHS